MINIRTALGSLVVAAFATCAYAQDSSEPYTVEVWARVLFNTEGTAAEYTLIDEARYPAKFAQNVKDRISKARIQPPEEGGKPATFRTGVRLDFLVTPTAGGGAQVRVSGLSMGPHPVKQYYAPFPTDIEKTAGWEGRVEGVCKVGTNGQCIAIEVKAPPGMPESVRRYARLSLQGWTFAPQEVNGKPIEGDFSLRFHLNSRDGAPEDFRQDKWSRILNSR